MAAVGPLAGIARGARMTLAARNVLQAMLIAAWLCPAAAAHAQEGMQAADHPPAARVEFADGTEVRTVEGEVLVEAADGGLLLRGPDWRLWLIQPGDIRSRTPLEAAPPPLEKKELEAALLKELPRGFRVRTTDHFVIAYNTDGTFARWVGNLYERLLRAFLEHWKRKRGYELEQPRVPMVVLVFNSLDEYSRHVRNELGTDPGSMVAYYHILNNRVAMYDLTSTFGPAGGSGQSIVEILDSPRAADMVATIIHEGTHQLMFNTGMQQRLADTPLWVNEGLAMYFETPDPNSPQGFRTIGRINPLRYRQFAAWLPHRPPGSLEQLLSDDAVLRSADQLTNRYGESWALVSFLLARHEKEFVAWLRHIRDKPLMVYDDPATRIAEFTSFFGADLAALDGEFVAWFRGIGNRP